MISLAKRIRYLSFNLFKNIAYQSYTAYLSALKRIRLLLLIISVLLLGSILFPHLSSFTLIFAEIYLYYCLIFAIRSMRISAINKTNMKNYQLQNLPLVFSDFAPLKNNQAKIAISFFKEQLIFNIKLLLNNNNQANLIRESCHKIALLVDAQNNDYLQNMAINQKQAIEFQNVITLPNEDNLFTQTIIKDLKFYHLSLNKNELVRFKPTLLSWFILTKSKYPKQWYSYYIVKNQ